MAEALVTVLIEQLASVALESIEENVSLVKNVDKDVKKLKTNLEAIQAVLEDAEKKQLTELSVKLWVEKLKDASFEIDNVLDVWNTAILKLKIQKEEDVDDHKANKICFSIPSPFSCCGAKVNRLALRHGIARKIKDLTQTLAEITSEKDQFKLSTTTTEKPQERQMTTSFIDETEVEGRDVDKEVLVSKLLGENSTQHDQGLQIIPIVGMGGLGKTTLAQIAYKDEKVIAHFDLRIWVCVSDPFEETKVAKAIIEAIEGSAPNINELESLMQRIVSGMNQKKFLLVLDDVWTTDKEKWVRLRLPLKSAGSEGSRIVVTTRKEEVAIMMEAKNQMMALEKLSEEHCWVVFKRLAFSERKEEECEELEEIGRKIADKSKGLPLVAKSLGSLMFFKKTKPQWEDVLSSHLWSLKNVEEIFTPFLLGYYDLSAKEKSCFLYCSIFPKDHEIEREELINMWMSQNYLRDEVDGVECFENLAMRSFFQNFKRGVAGNIIECKMHDVVHDFAQFLTKNECVTIEADKVEGDQKPPHEKVRHLTLVVGSLKNEVRALNYNESNKRNIRTLYIAPKSTSILDSMLFLQLNCLRSLTLNECDIKKIPSSIGNMKHLRYLDLSSNGALEELPETVCDLCNLQTLDLVLCISLRRLPEGIGKLINLRHLYVMGCFQLEGFPKGIGKLTSLRSLDTLFVGENKETHFDNEDLKRLRNVQLKGEITIKGCRNLGMRDDGAKQLDLKNITQKADGVMLDFGEWREGSSLEEESALLEHLEPHHNLLSLYVRYYMGTIASPRWMASLLNLREICLYECKNCEMLPSLGELPCLERILFMEMDSVKVVGVEFLEITESVSPITFFPKLKELSFYFMPEWEKWEGMKTAASETNSSSLITIMPCLLTLTFKLCPCLKVLPDFLKTTTSLKELSISSSEIMEEWCRERTGDEWDKISHVPNIEINDSYVRKDGVFR